MPVSRTIRLVLAASVVPALALSMAPTVQAHVPPLRHIAASGVFAAPAVATNAFDYTADATDESPDLVPAGASARVHAWYPRNGRTYVLLRVRGLLPNREYGAHAHTTACGATGAEAGPHFQYEPQVPAPSAEVPVDPAYANSANEIWLDFTTDAMGRGWAFSRQDWQPSADRRPASVVIHIQHTADGTVTGSPAGSAGARLACLTVGF